jgi:hypothetical protein
MPRPVSALTPAALSTAVADSVRTGAYLFKAVYLASFHAIRPLTELQTIDFEQPVTLAIVR